MKTDNDNLFEFTLEEIDDLRKSENMKILGEEVTRNLHGSEYAEGNVMTEYEEEFSNRGKNINHVKITRG